MAKTTQPLLPALARTLTTLGENVRLARLLRRLRAGLVAEWAWFSRPTLRTIKHGRAGVTLGAYAHVLHCLGLDPTQTKGQEIFFARCRCSLGTAKKIAGMGPTPHSPPKKPKGEGRPELFFADTAPQKRVQGRGPHAVQPNHSLSMHSPTAA